MSGKNFPIKWKVAIPIIVSVTAAIAVAVFFTGYETESIVVDEIKHSTLSGYRDTVLNSLTTMMLAGNMKEAKGPFLEQMQKIVDLRVMRAEILDRDYGKVDGKEYASDPVEKEVLETGKERVVLEGQYIRGIYPYIAKSDFMGKNCLSCHNVGEGTVLGAISIKIPLVESLQRIKSLQYVYAFFGLIGLLILAGLVTCISQVTHAESERRYHLLFDQAPDGILLIDTEGKIIEFNEETHRRLGYSREEFAKLSLSDIDPVESPNEIQASIRGVMKKGKSEFDVKHRTKAGDIRDVHVITQPVVLSGSVVLYTIWHDITERKSHEEKLRKSQMSLAKAQEIALIGDWEWDIVTSKIGWSDQLYRIYGFEPHEIEPDYELVLKALHPDSKDEFLRAIDAALKGRLPFEIDYAFFRKDGSAATLHARGQVIYDNSGTPVRMVGTAQDITERKRAEGALRDSEEKFRAIFDKANDGILIACVTTRKFVEANNTICEMLGYAREEILALGIKDIHPEKFLPHVLEEFERQVRGEKKISENQPVLRKDGSVFYADICVASVTFGGEHYAIGIFRDITDRRSMEEALKKSYEELELRVRERTSELKTSREQLRRLASHLQSVREEERTKIARDIHDELGQMLLGLNMDLTWFRDKYGDHGPIFDKIESVLHTLNTTIQSVKRICTELRPSLLDDFGLAAAIEWQATEFQERTGIKCTLTEEPWGIELDKEQSIAFYRIFQEALTNVLKHSEATVVTSRLTRNNSSITLEIRDNGKGITDKQLSKSQSFGIIGMRERVYPWRGNVEITGGEGTGTTVRVSVPFTKKSATNV